jgi:hypothetical protein
MVERWEVYEDEEIDTESDKGFLSSVLDDCGKDCEEFLDVKCPHCHKVFNLGDCFYYQNNPTCPHCGFN